MSTTDQLGDLGSIADAKRILKDEFNTGVPQIATAVAVIMGTLGLSKFGFNAGSWTVIAVLTFCLVFLYRRYIPANLAQMTGWAVLFAVISIIPAVVLYLYRDKTYSDLRIWLSTYSYPASAYASFVSTAILASIVTAYRKQELIGGVFPSKIQNALSGEFYSLPFYKTDVEFTIQMGSPEQIGVPIRTILSYTVVNRTELNQEWRVQYGLNHKNGYIESVEIAKKQINLKEHPSYVRKTGIDIPKTLNKNESVEVKIIARDWFEARDSEIYTSYHPATDLTIEIQYPKESINCFFDVLHSSKDEPQYTKSGKRILLQGLLPYQGARLNWNTLEGENNGKA